VPLSGCPYVRALEGCHDRLVALSVLLVDDDPDFLTLAARVVEAKGARVVATAQDAASAVAAAKDTEPQAALVDVGLPDRNGFDLGAELAALSWKPRVVMTSSDSMANSAIESSDGGSPLPFIPKQDLATADRLCILLGAD
jgi:DNA-binding NarL/FixJ family response regulator